MRLREFYEETGLTVAGPRMRGVLTFPAFDDQEDWYVFVFTAEDYSGTLKKSCPEGDLHWIDNERLEELPLWEGDKVFMKWLDDHRFFSGKLLYHRGGFQSCSVVFHGGDH